MGSGNPGDETTWNNLGRNKLIKFKTASQPTMKQGRQESPTNHEARPPSKASGVATGMSLASRCLGGGVAWWNLRQLAIYGDKLPWKLTCPLKNDGWNTIFTLKYNGTPESLAEQFLVTDFTNYMGSIGLPCFSRTRPCASHQLHLKGSKINCKLWSQAIPSWETNVLSTGRKENHLQMCLVRGYMIY